MFIKTKPAPKECARLIIKEDIDQLYSLLRSIVITVVSFKSPNRLGLSYLGLI